MTAFYTILQDSFRMLKNSLIFWITLGISGFVAALFLGLGFDEKGVTFFGASVFEEEAFSKGSIGAEMFYKSVFESIIVGGWLSWATIILALISCASIYPQMMEEGSAGMLLTKRPSRWVIFFAKYVGSLLFMVVQVALFVVVVLFAMRWRLGTWSLEILWFIPATVLVFSFLYSFTVFLAVRTKSVLTAILLTLLLWLVSFGVESFEAMTYSDLMRLESKIELEGGDVDLKQTLRKLKLRHQKLKIGYAFSPKVTPMIHEASKAQKLRSDETGLSPELGKSEQSDSDHPPTDAEVVAQELEEEMKQGFMGGLEREIELQSKIAERHTLTYTLGTSLLFEVVMLLLAGRSFSKKEF